MNCECYVLHIGERTTFKNEASNIVRALDCTKLTALCQDKYSQRSILTRILTG